MTNQLFGLETEYGIAIEGREEAIDVVAESIAIVRAYTGPAVTMKWDYRLEDPHRDARGFRAAELRQDSDEANYQEADEQRPLSFREIKSDQALTNGARFYNDHAHPEYSTPECATLADLIAHDKAGEAILHQCARARNATLPEGEQVRLYKNNTDFQGHAYGCHDNYLLSRSVPWEGVVAALVPFLITRQLYAGAGKLGIEQEGGPTQAGHYQLSQRADFLSVLTSIDTMNQRPIVNTRDEPHAERHRYRRFHGILGDANMNEIATALKVGTTALVLRLVERGGAPLVELADPIGDAKAISRHPNGPWLVTRGDQRTISAPDLQRLYLQAVLFHLYDELDEEMRWVVREWEGVLNDLERDPMLTLDRVDWVAKRFLLDTFREEQRLDWDDPWLMAIDLEYHHIDPESGLYYEMARSCTQRRLVSDEAVARAVMTPPVGSRAAFRGRAVEKFGGAITSIQWEEVAFRTARGERTLSLREVLDPISAAAWQERIERAGSVDELFET